MSSTAQILANRDNSLKSTGPSSESGKLASSKNAISHGLSSTGDPVLPHEDRQAFDALLDRYKLDFSPSAGHEEFLVVTMVAARWRLERAGRIENSIFSEMFDSPEGAMAQTSPEGAMAQTMMSKEGDALLRLERYRAGIERTYHRCTRELHASQKWNIDAYTTQQAEKKFNKLMYEYIYAPIPRKDLAPIQKEASLPVQAARKIGRNESCPCGSGLKYKKCCLDKSPATQPTVYERSSTRPHQAAPPVDSASAAAGTSHRA